MQDGMGTYRFLSPLRSDRNNRNNSMLTDAVRSEW